MKNELKLLMMILLLIGCKKEIPIIEKEVVCIIDGTDTTIRKPSFKEILPFINLSNNDFGLRFKSKMLGDIDFGSTYEKKLEPKNPETDETAEERFLRKKKFFKELEVGYAHISKLATPKQHSIIYRIIANELNRLSESNAKDKVVLVNSDLMENSEEINFYKAEDYNLLFSNPTDLEARFSSQNKLKNLNGIKVYFLFQPKDFYENKSYKSVLAIYQNLINKAGGICYVGINP